MNNCRFIFLAAVCLSFFATYMNRNTIPIALVSICRESSSDTVNKTSPEFADESSDLETIYSYFPRESLSSQNNLKETLDVCQQSYKGYIVSATYVSSLIFQIPFGIVISKFGGFNILFFGMLFTGVFSAIFPFVVYQSAWLVILARFLIGATAAATSPAVFHLIDVWMLKKDKPIASTLTSASQTLGTIVTLASVGLIDQTFSWPGIFHFTAIAALISTVIIICTIRENPSQVSWMTQRELNILQNERKIQKIHRDDKKNISTPWLSIMSNKAILSLLFFRFSVSWINSIFATQLAFFLDEVPRMSLKENGNLSSATQVTRFISTIFAGYLADFVIRRKYLSRINTRKVFGFILGAGQAVSLLLIPFVTFSTVWLYFMLLASTFLSGFSAASTIPMHYELSSKYAVALFTISNTTTNLTGFLLPNFVGLIRTIMVDLDPITIWALIFASSAAMVSLACVLFLIFANAEDQDYLLDHKIDSKCSSDSELSIISTLGSQCDLLEPRVISTRL